MEQKNKFKIIISPYSRQLRSLGKENPKNYPFWNDVVSGLKLNGVYIYQIGVQGEKKIEGVDEFLVNKSLKDLEVLVKECDTWISVDNFFQHLCYLIDKPGIVLFGPSDPLIFGHKENINLLKDRKFLRKFQFASWEDISKNDDVFVFPDEVINTILRRISNG